MKIKYLWNILCLGTLLVVSGCASKCASYSIYTVPGDVDKFFRPPPTSLSFNPFRTNVYDSSELLAECTTNFNMEAADSVYQSTVDWQCYTSAMVKDSQARTDLTDTILRNMRLHDFAIENGLDKYIKQSMANQSDWKGVVGIMGRHDLPRQEKVINTTNDATYMQIALLAQKLSQNGYTVATGGGPGAMEAGNLGAWFAGYSSDKELREAVRMLEKYPVLSTNLTTGQWLFSAFQVIHKYPRTNDLTKSESIGVPTWFYGSEPPNPFATRIAKYFENSLREDHLLAICKQGVIFTPGNGGTVQEIFQSACPNYYAHKHFPMVLFGADYWNPSTNNAKTTDGIPISVWPTMQSLAAKGRFADSVILTNDVDATVEFIKANTLK